MSGVTELMSTRLGREDDRVLTLYTGTSTAQPTTMSKASLVYGLAVVLIEALASVHDELIKLCVGDIVHVVGTAGCCAVVCNVA